MNPKQDSAKFGPTPDEPSLPEDPVLLQQMICELLRRLGDAERRQEQLSRQIQRVSQKLEGRRRAKRLRPR
jgi:hypothetical protein